MLFKISHYVRNDKEKFEMTRGSSIWQTLLSFRRSTCDWEIL